MVWRQMFLTHIFNFLSVKALFSPQLGGKQVPWSPKKNLKCVPYWDKEQTVFISFFLLLNFSNFKSKFFEIIANT